MGALRTRPALPDLIGHPNDQGERAGRTIEARHHRDLDQVGRVQGTLTKHPCRLQKRQQGAAGNANEHDATTRAAGQEQEQTRGNGNEAQQLEHRDRQTQHVTHHQGTPEAYTDVVAASPQLASEECLEGRRIAKMNRPKARIAQNPTARLAEALAQVHILAGLQSCVEAANSMKGPPPHRQVPATEPVHLPHARMMAAQPIVLPLHPCTVRRRVVGRACSNDRGTAQRLDCARSPRRVDLVIGIHESKDVTLCRVRNLVPHLGYPQARQREHGCAGRQCHGGRVVGRAVIRHDDLDQLGRVGLSPDAGETQSQTRGVVAHGHHERDAAVLSVRHLMETMVSAPEDRHPVLSRQPSGESADERWLNGIASSLDTSHLAEPVEPLPPVLNPNAAGPHQRMDSRRPAAGQAPPGTGVMQLVLSLDPGGTERLTIEIARRLAHRFRMVVCCLDEPGQWAAELEAVGIPVVSLRRAPGFHPSLGMRVAALAAEMEVSVIHCHHYSSFVYGTIATLRARRLSMLYTEHGRLSDAPPTLKRRVANAVLSRGSGSAFAVSFALREHMLAEGFRGRPVAVIHNGIEVNAVPSAEARLAARRMLGLPERCFVVGTVARLDPVKNLTALVSAAARIATSVPAMRLLIVGDGPERAVVEDAARQAGIERSVVITGYRPDARELLAACDVYVNASVSEGVSLTILEAMAAALPVVATRVGGTPEVVLDGTTGLLVAPRSAEALAAAITALAADPGLRARLAAAGRARVEVEFTIERMVEDYAREYSRLGSP